VRKYDFIIYAYLSWYWPVTSNNRLSIWWCPSVTLPPPPPVGVWSIAMSLSRRLVCLSVYLSVCPSPRVAQTPDVQMSTNFLYMLPVAVARSSSGGNAICYVLPVCGWRHIMEQICQNQRLRMFCPVCQVAAPGTKSAVFDCILFQLCNSNMLQPT